MIRIDEVITEVVVEGRAEPGGEGATTLDVDHLRELVRALLREELERSARVREER